LTFIAGTPTTDLPLTVKGDIPLPGDASRLDYASGDFGRARLYIAHLGAGTVIVVDTKNAVALTEIPDVAAVHGVLVVPSLRLVYASATGTNEVVAIDEITNKIIARMPGGVYPDGMAYDPDTKQLFVSDEDGGTETVLDVVNNHRVATIQLGGGVGNTQYDLISKSVFVDVQTRNELVELDPRSLTVTARYHLADCVNDHGLLIDAPHRRAYIACDGNARLLTFDLRTKAVIGDQSVGSEPDVLGLDARARTLYVASESGIVSVFDVSISPIKKLGEGLLAPHAHVVTVDQNTHTLYFPLQDIGGRPVLRIAAPTDGAR
jgi:DNA-binding beta-propeller fold protein YncE